MYLMLHVFLDLLLSDIGDSSTKIAKRSKRNVRKISLRSGVTKKKSSEFNKLMLHIHEL